MTPILTEEKQTVQAKRPRGTGAILRRKRSPFLWIQYYIDGKAYRESTQTTDEKKAQKLLQLRLAEVASGNFLTPQSRRVRVEELAEDFLRDYRINQKKSIDDAKARWELHLKPEFAHLRATAVTTAHLNNYVDKRLAEGAAVATINRELAALKRMFYLGQEITPPKVLRVPKFPKLEEHNIRTGFVEHGQYKALADAASKIGLWLRAMFETAYAFGFRVGELQNLHVRQVDLMSCMIRLERADTKNKAVKTAMITEQLYPFLASLVTGKQGDEFVFTRDGKPVRDFRIAWAKICLAAGVGKLVCRECKNPVETREGQLRCSHCNVNWNRKDVKYLGLIFHDLRRTAVRNMIRAGIPEKVAMQISGHKTRSMLDRYNIIDERDVQEATMRIESAQRLRDQQFSGTDSGTEPKTPIEPTESKTTRLQ